jgi:hypothetical protein
MLGLAALAYFASQQFRASAGRSIASTRQHRVEIALPTEDAKFALPPGAANSTAGWSAVLATVAPPTEIELDAIVTELQSPGSPDVEEAFNDGADGRVAVATCRGSTPVIYYSAADLSRFDERATVFVRQHELAHHRLGQIDCSTDPPQFGKYDEKSADCAAVHNLITLGARGRDAIMAISAIFYYINKPASPPYPGTKDRSRYLAAGCGESLP